MKKKIAILGSTGSIGENTLEIIKQDKKKFEVNLLSTNKNIKKVFSKKEKQKSPNIIDFILEKIRESKTPEEFSDEEWERVKKAMIFAFSAKKRKYELRSKSKQKVEKYKTHEGFKLFESNIKHL